MANNFRITRSNYTIKKKHKALKDGSTIYERDFMTTTNLGAFDGGAFPLGEHNFKMVTVDKTNKSRVHKYGEWEKADDGEEYWTGENTHNGSDKPVTTENTISLKPNYNSLLDFAYYGSATELVKTTLKHIINTYPAEMYVTGEDVKYTVLVEKDGEKKYKYCTLGEGQEGLTEPVKLENPFNIDIVTTNLTFDEKQKIDNPLRYFDISSNKYLITDADGVNIGTTENWRVEKHIIKECYKNGDLVNKIFIGNVIIKSVSPFINPLIPDDEIWYTTIDGKEIEPANMKAFNENELSILDNAYNNGKGIMKLDGRIDFVADYAFLNCDRLETVWFPDSTAFIGINAFEGCTNLHWDGVYECNLGDAENEDIRPLYVYQFYLDGAIISLVSGIFSGMHIKPVMNEVDNFFSTLDDFEQVLLDRNTEPLFTVSLDTPRETEDGFITYIEKYSWPTINGWNIDVTSGAYETYVKRLLNLASFYDEYYSNNLWRMICHDAVKNMDRTYEVEHRNEDESDVREGVSKMEGFLLSCARLFDDLKRYTDNIKYCNSITYNENNNVPDYFLSDKLEIEGWDVTSAVKTLDKEETTDALFTGDLKSYGNSDTNLRFMKNLMLNSRSILLRKGTQNAIEMLLGLFGFKSYNNARHTTVKYTYIEPDTEIERNTYNFHSIPIVGGKRVEYTSEKVNIDELDIEEQKHLYDYKIEEYVAVAKNTPDGIIEEGEPFSGEIYEKLTKKYNEEMDFVDAETTLEGLPVVTVLVEKLVEGEIKTYKYLIPWFDKTGELKGEPYFQLYGGWGKRHSKEITGNKNCNRIISNKNFSIYEETHKYLHMVHSVSDLQKFQPNELTNEEIFYVSNLDDFEEHYGRPATKEVSHYFCIPNVNDCKYYDRDDEEAKGWMNIPVADIEYGENYGQQVLYLESIIDSNKGNNPHVGYGKYDDGETYLDYFRQIFKNDIETDNFVDDAYDCATGEIKDEIKNYGFGDVSLQMDNAKCWFFANDKQGNSRLIPIIKGNKQEVSDGYMYTTYGWTNDKNGKYVGRYITNDGYTEIDGEKVKIGKLSDGFYESQLNTYNFETEAEGGNEEPAAYSVINTKRLKISFYGTNILYKDFEKYFNESILPYLKQIIPSTTILEIFIETEGLRYTSTKLASIEGML